MPASMQLRWPKFIAGCKKKDCGGPGGATCPAGQACKLPPGICDPDLAMGVCMNAATLPACVSCESDCSGETHCEDGKIAKCLEIGGCMKSSLYACPADKTCVGPGMCVAPTGILGLPCNPDGSCPYITKCVGAGPGSAGLCSPPCATCEGATCTAIAKVCDGFGPGGDGTCIGPLAIGSENLAVCAIPCTAKGQCPAGLSCKTVPTPFGGPVMSACLSVGL